MTTTTHAPDAPAAPATPSLLDPPSGCVFHTRCPYAFEPCEHEPPVYEQIQPGRWIACHLHGEIP